MNKVIATMDINVLDFILPPLMCRHGAEGPFQSNHCEGKGTVKASAPFSKYSFSLPVREWRRKAFLN